MNTLVTPQFHQPLQVKTLADKAVLVRLRRSMWSPYAFDQGATTVAEAQFGVAKAGRFNKHLMKNSKALKDVQAAYSAVYTYIRENTLPWLDDGLRLLRADRYIDVTAEARRLISAADQAVQQLVQCWAADVQADMGRLGTMANPQDYPEDIAAEFGIALSFLPVPTTGDFRVGLEQSDIDSLQNEIALAEKQAAKYVIEQLIEPLDAAVRRLGEYTGAKGQRFHGSTLTNILEVATRMEKVNISDDPAVKEAIRKVKQTAQPLVLNVSAVKDDEQVREQVRTQVKQLADTFAGIV